MKLPKLFASAIASACIILATNVASMAQTAEEIVNKHIEAIGGVEKWNAVKTLQMTNRIGMGGMDVAAKTTILVGRGMRSEVSVMGQQMITVVDGDAGWMLRPAMMGGNGSPEDMPSAVVKQSKSQMEVGGPLFNAKQKGLTIELVGKEKVDKVEAFKLNITNKEGEQTQVFVSPTTFYAIKVTAKRLVQGQEVNMDISFSDFKTVDGLVFAYTTEMPNPAMGGNMTIETEEVKVNLKVDETILQKPAK